MKKTLLFLAFVSAAVPLFAAESNLSLAKAALASKDRASADFWISRHLTETDYASDPELDKLLKVMRLSPKGFIPSTWTPETQQWFLERGRRMWKVSPEHVHADERRVEIASAAQDGFFATLTAAPEIQAWYELKDGLSSERRIIVAAAGKPSPTIAFGPLIPDAKKNQPSALVRIFSLRALHHGTLEFKDEDGDGKPELVARLTWIVSNGFEQTVRIYRLIAANQLELWKTLNAPGDTPVVLD